MADNKYGRPKKRNLDKKAVKKFLEGIGFEIEVVDQEWRHLHAFGKFNGKNAVFKLASTQTTSPRTQNEYHWNEAVHLVDEKERPNFTVPQNYSFGHYGKLYYFVAERFMGKPLVERNSSSLKKAIPRIPQIAQATYELENLPIPSSCNFAQTKKSKRQKQIPVGHRLLNSATEWAGKVPRDLDKFLSVVDEQKDSLRTSVGHGDFVIRQLYDVDGKIGVIDGEHAGMRGPLYYDVAQFYIRLRNDHNAKDVAKVYLKEFMNILSKPDKKSFWEELKPVLIQRYIGDLWGAKDREDELDRLEELGKEILSDTILN